MNDGKNKPPGDERRGRSALATGAQESLTEDKD